MLRLYQWLVILATPFLKIHLRRRLARGKEDPARLYERFGGASLPRPKGKLVWIHAASVGESVSVLKLIQDLTDQHPKIKILLTTGTVTSARLMAQRLPKSVIHQYIPLDVPNWIARFLDHWQPNHVMILESELWPNMLSAIKKRNLSCWLVNARLSPKSYRRWRYLKGAFSSLMSSFDKIFTPTSETLERLKDLGVNQAELSVNLKYTTDPLPLDIQEVTALKKSLKRPIIAVVSTHAGEESFILESIQVLRKEYPNLLIILAPRHPDRAETVLGILDDQRMSVARRSLREVPSQKTDVWLIDTIGDLGLVYSLAPVCVLGGSFEAIGGHNPIEPYNLGCIVVQGKHTFNFTDTNQILASALTEVTTQTELSKALLSLYGDLTLVETKKAFGQQVLDSQKRGLEILIQEIVEAVSC